MSAVPPSPVLPRRTVARGAAWALPVVTLAAAAPGASASVDVCGCLAATRNTSASNGYSRTSEQLVINAGISWAGCTGGNVTSVQLVSAGSAIYETTDGPVTETVQVNAGGGSATVLNLIIVATGQVLTHTVTGLTLPVSVAVTTVGGRVTTCDAVTLRWTLDPESDPGGNSGSIDPV